MLYDVADHMAMCRYHGVEECGSMHSPRTRTTGWKSVFHANTRCTVCLFHGIAQHDAVNITVSRYLEVRRHRLTPQHYKDMLKQKCVLVEVADADADAVCSCSSAYRL